MAGTTRRLVIPPYVNRGEEVRAEDHNKIIRLLHDVVGMLRELTPQPSPDIGHRFGPGGVSSFLKRRGGGSKAAGRKLMFEVHSLRQGEDDSWTCKVEPGFILTVRPGVNADAIGYIDPSGATEDIPVEEGQSLYVKVTTGPADLVTAAEYIVEADKDSEHAQPGTPEGEERDGEYWYKLATFQAPETENGPPVIKPYHQGGPIIHRATLWAGANVGGGAGVMYKWNGESSRYEFRGLLNLFGIVAEESGETVNIRFNAENVGDTGYGQEVLKDPNGENGEGGVPGEKAKFRRIAGRGADAAINTETDGETIRIKGTDINDTIEIPGGIEFEFKDGLLRSFEESVDPWSGTLQFVHQSGGGLIYTQLTVAVHKGVITGVTNASGGAVENGGTGQFWVTTADPGS